MTLKAKPNEAPLRDHRRSCKRNKPKPISQSEKEQVRIRRNLGLPVRLDGHGRERAPNGTADAGRQLSQSNGVVRISSYDPLIELRWLSSRQRNAGNRYREAYEALASHGIKPPSLDLKVDGGRAGKDILEAALDAASAVRHAHRAISHPDIIVVVEHVCGMRQSIRAASTGTGKRRDALIALLAIGLDQMAEAFFGAERRSD
jgi:hypothetical protein